MKPAVKTVASIAIIAGSAHAIVIPPWISASSSSNNAAGSHGDSSVRKSVNFGPTPHAITLSSIVDPTPDLSLFNAETDAAFVADRCPVPAAAECVGNTIANGFIAKLHPHANFRLSSAHVSKHSRVYHAYFVQVAHDGLPIVNSFFNINVDLKTLKVLSYGDSSYARSNTDASGWRTKLAKWAATQSRVASQLVFGGAQEARAQAAGHNVDPRHGLLSLLALVTDELEIRNMIAFDRDAVLSSMTSTSLDDDNLLITGVPTAVKDVKASLAYLNVDGKLRLVWQYELYTNDNAYEACVAADADAIGAEEPLVVVDLVRDFRPTGGEIVRVGDALVPLSQNGAEPRKTRRNPLISMRDAMKRQELIRDTTREVTELASKERPAVSPSYKVFPWGMNDPAEGKRLMLKGTLVEMSNEASPAGWHTVPTASKNGKDTFYHTTRGNNAIAQDNPDGMNSFENNYRPSGGEDMSFAFPLHWPKAGHELDPASYINASVTELFYTTNELHDFFYLYGFDEASGNFQESNFDRGGAGGDAVQANAQDGSGMNNANFMTPPDGSRPRMRMYVWNAQQPYRDGDFESGIVTHEYSHGVSTRLTGGRMNSGCLGWGEAGGAGEGWGDFFATMIRMHDLNATEYSMGEWASGRIGGIRNYRYSRNMTTNPDTYKSLDKPGYWGVHAIGEVWAEMLFEVAELLIEDHGFQTGSLFPPAADAIETSDFYDDKYAKRGTRVPKHGNTLAIQLVLDAMKIQPCRPSFFNMRDAIVQADYALTGGDNACAIWKGFAKRGLGPKAAIKGQTPWGGGVRSEDFGLPAKCESKSKKPKHAIA